ncbi:MAG TPA: lytic transglycosylase domain-containing protein [Desulfosalsimonadaceae bacterium]|nr:lytic transglycosylase domain-containing protein [Desulfosalsimonadaceae bacterium]
MQVHQIDTYSAGSDRAGSSKSRVQERNFARELEASLADSGSSQASGPGEKISLGTISRDNPTVSHLLVEHPEYGDDCWDIIHAGQNRDKPYTGMQCGTEVYLNPETREITWGGADRNAHNAGMEQIQQSISRAADRHNLPRKLIAGVIQAESGFNASAVSGAGARGLMQLMPDTARELGVDNPFDIQENIDAGARYLKKMLDLFGGSLKTALAAYNAGPGTVEQFGGEVPYAETRQYVAQVMSFLK